ncbi:MAG: TadE family protein [Candidatus Sericytochromatia bacterium]
MKHETRNNDSGQAMVEFALVLPFLALLTFGTLEVALYLQQQSAMNGAAFIAARSAAVLGADKAGTDKALKAYTDATGMPWLQTAKVTDGSSKGNGVAKYTLVAGSDRLTGLISGLTGGKVTGFDTLSAEAVLAMEYDARGYYGASQSATYKAKTISLIEYPSFEKPPNFSADGAFRSVKTVVGAIKEVTDVIQKLQKPSPAPSKPPGPGTNPQPKPTPNAGVTPQPKPMPSPPDLSSFALIDGAKEPFQVRKAVEKNPRRRDDKNGDGGGDGNEVYSQDYVAPGYEADEVVKDRIKFKMKHLVTELKTYEGVLNGDQQVLGGKASVDELCQKLGRLAEPYKANPLVKGALNNVDKFAKPLWDNVDKVYVKYNKDEKDLFKK